MFKRDEITVPASCLNRAFADEMIFVLLARDIAAPETIRFWVSRRLALGKNEPTDIQIRGALAAADTMERQARDLKVGGQQS